MAKLSFPGLSEYELVLSRLGEKTEEIAGKAVYEGTAIVADEIRKGIEGLPIVSGFGTEEKPLPGGVTQSQKKGLLNGLGISKIRNDYGYINVKIGFDDYNSTMTKKYPNGQPNALVARGVEGGTSWKQKHPFVRPAVSRSKKASEKAMQEALDREIAKITE